MNGLNLVESMTTSGLTSCANPLWMAVCLALMAQAVAPAMTQCRPSCAKSLLFRSFPVAGAIISLQHFHTRVVGGDPILTDDLFDP